MEIVKQGIPHSYQKQVRESFFYIFMNVPYSIENFAMDWYTSVLLPLMNRMTNCGKHDE